MMSKKTKYILLIIIAIVAVFNTNTVKAEDGKSCWVCKVGNRNYIKMLSDEEKESGVYGKCYMQAPDEQYCTQQLPKGQGGTCAKLKMYYPDGDKEKIKYFFGYVDTNSSFIKSNGLIAKTFTNTSNCDNDTVDESSKDSKSGTGSKKSKRNEDEIGGSLADESSSNAESSSSQAIIQTTSKNINGFVCKAFNVGPGHKTSIKYTTNQASWVYAVAPDATLCPDGGSYTAFCLDPDMDGIYTGTVKYSAQTINTSSTYNQMLYELYLLYKNDGSSGDLKTMIYQTAARLLAYADGSDYLTQRSTTKGTYATHLDVWEGGPFNPGNVAQNGAEAGIEKAQTAYNNWVAKGGRTGEYEKNVMTNTLGLRISQLGGFTYNADSDRYETKFNIIVENYTGKPSENDIHLEVKYDGNNIQYQGPEINNDTHELIYSVVVSGKYTKDCLEKELTATIKYASEGDIRQAGIIAANGAGGSGKQRFAVFRDDAGSETVISNKLKVTFGDCKKSGNDENACQVDGELVCGSDDGTLAVINEGSQGGGSTDWENCIFNKTDPKGNQYDVVNTSSSKNEKYGEDKEDTDVNQDDDLNRDQIIARLTNGDIIREANYCTVSCKEKYAFLLPGEKKDVKQGTYFSFHSDMNDEKNAVVGISGERLCVSDNINVTKFKNVIADLRKQQVDYLNMYMYYKQLYNTMYNAKNAHIYLQNAKDNGEPYVEKLEDKAHSHCSDKFDHSWGSATNHEPFEDNVLLNHVADGSKYKYKELYWLPAVAAGELNYETKPFKYYVLNDPYSLDGGFEEKTISYSKLDKTFKDSGIPIYGNLSMYEKYYKGYNSNIWNTNTKIDEFKHSYLVTGITHKWHSSYGGGCSTCTPPTSDQCQNEETKKEEATIFYNKYWDDKYLTDNSDIKGNQLYEKYNIMLSNLEKAYKAAKTKYDALNRQISLQSENMQLCTNYTKDAVTKDTFQFNPDITFSYPDQDNYMAMLAPNKLVNMNEGIVDSQYDLYYGDDDPNSLFDRTPENDREKEEYKFEKIFDDKDPKWADNVNPEININKHERDSIGYYSVSRVGSRTQYGRFNEFNQPCDNRSKFSATAGNKSNYCYEFYQSAGQFFTYPPDGLVTLNKNVDNGTILDHDGRVYPVTISTSEGPYPYYVTFANIGQYNESGNLGRLMGGADSVLNGEYENIEVCNYEVCRIDDPDCNPNPCPPGSDDPECNPETCSDVILTEPKCNKGNVSNIINVNDDDYLACLNAVLKKDDGKGICCDDIERLINGRMNTTGSDYSNGFLPSRSDRFDYDLFDYMNDYCSETSVCNSFSLISTSISASSQNSDNTIIIDNESLQMNARTISLNKIFMDENSRGVNWTTNEARTVEQSIIQHGETIFDNDPDYEMTLNAECISAIKEYNNAQDSSGNDTLGNGGYNDYTLVVKDDSSKPGSVAVWDEDNNFFKAVSKACGLSYHEPDEIKDSSKVKS